jgi:hypothetical protein
MTRLETRLAALAAAGETTTYGALAQELGLRVAELTARLEALMEEDATEGRPFRAALLSARGTDLPARGFFDKAAELGAVITDRAGWVADHRRHLATPI